MGIEVLGREPGRGTGGGSTVEVVGGGRGVESCAGEATWILGF